eukprot:scaffold11274_cov79-Phaeocystis_antarctica.AAC.1
MGAIRGHTPEKIQAGGYFSPSQLVRAIVGAASYYLSTRIFHRRSLPDIRATMRATRFPSCSAPDRDPQPTRGAFSAPPHTS